MRLILPTPPSVNNLFINVRGRGRVPSARYADWRRRATAELWGQPMQNFAGPVEVKIVAEDAGRTDLDNFAKGVLDFLVHHRFIEDDNRSVVRRLTLEWGDVKGVVVEVSAV